mmetsp:Transcript_7289/g.14381  ORF Transcript_7289/g.14381 Transcript_7289/m.14381 type:complete len:185 (+) Transcript_7289:3-557(+)
MKRIRNIEVGFHMLKHITGPFVDEFVLEISAQLDGNTPQVITPVAPVVVVEARGADGSGGSAEGELNDMGEVEAELSRMCDAQLATAALPEETAETFGEACSGYKRRRIAEMAVHVNPIPMAALNCIQKEADDMRVELERGFWATKRNAMMEKVRSKANDMFNKIEEPVAQDDRIIGAVVAEVS